MTGVAYRVYVRKGEVVAERLVVLGQSAGDLVEVKGQIAAGDEHRPGLRARLHALEPTRERDVAARDEVVNAVNPRIHAI